MQAVLQAEAEAVPGSMTTTGYVHDPYHSITLQLAVVQALAEMRQLVLLLQQVLFAWVAQGGWQASTDLHQGPLDVAACLL